jgi:hypothetical protein
MMTMTFQKEMFKVIFKILRKETFKAKHQLQHIQIKIKKLKRRNLKVKNDQLSEPKNNPTTKVLKKLRTGWQKAKLISIKNFI